MKLTKVFIVDDHELVREGIRKILSRFPDIAIVGESNSAEELLGSDGMKDADLILLDIALPGRSGLEILTQLKGIRADARILFLSMFSEEQFAIRALKAGADGYISKKAAAQELVDAIHAISRGKKYVSPTVKERLVEEIQSPSHPHSMQTLSDRELSVLRLIAEGKGASEIARQLFLSVNTVMTYRRRLLKKLGLKTNADLVRYALENDIIL